MPDIYDLVAQIGQRMLELPIQLQERLKVRQNLRVNGPVAVRSSQYYSHSFSENQLRA